MAYAHTTYGQLKTELAYRLEDVSKIFWMDRELGFYLQEALRTFGILSAFWRERGTFQTVADTAFYNLESKLPNLLGYSVTDQDVMEMMRYQLLETPRTVMFRDPDFAGAIIRRRNQFL